MVKKCCILEKIPYFCEINISSQERILWLIVSIYSFYADIWYIYIEPAK